jgi:hypothetical protein
VTPGAVSFVHGQPQRGGWHRPVRPLALVLVGALLLLLWLAMMVASTWYVYVCWDARIDLRSQSVKLRLHEGIEASAQVSAPVRSRLDLSPRMVVPLHQTVSAQVYDSVQARMHLRSHVLVDTVVHIAKTVPVRTSLQLSVPVVSWLPSFDVSVPLTLDLPVQMDVPVKLDVPLNLDALVNGELRAPLQVPMNVDLVLHPQIHAPVQVRLTRQMTFQLLGPMEPMPVQIVRAQLRVPFSVPTLR